MNTLSDRCFHQLLQRAEQDFSKRFRLLAVSGQVPACGTGGAEYFLAMRSPARMPAVGRLKQSGATAAQNGACALPPVQSHDQRGTSALRKLRASVSALLPQRRSEAGVRRQGGFRSVAGRSAAERQTGPPHLQQARSPGRAGDQSRMYFINATTARTETMVIRTIP
jgi:hypothetical protein